MSVKQIEVDEFLQKLENQELAQTIILDVREPHEYEQYKLDEALFIPMNDVPYSLDRLPKDKAIYSVCAHGMRSQFVADYLVNHGYENVINVVGGMAAIAAQKGVAYD
ncbi:rhodanese-like domain-containing protein [Longirhabdus pacifica]|uniref:rhodanese-like domain-containing protein n=1 Tax=Longirhabdus pacifica TaxID=2305227 RepID=UPI0010093299|nr:rhodanese-like domain-containing protein [Longirhabdus pacifica]